VKHVHHSFEYLPRGLGRSACSSLAHVRSAANTLSYWNQWLNPLPKIVSHHP
jgi:hypothetical protein